MRKMAKIVILSLVLALSSCGNSNMEAELAQKDEQLEELKSKNAELEKEIEELKASSSDIAKLADIYLAASERDMIDLAAAVDIILPITSATQPEMEEVIKDSKISIVDARMGLKLQISDAVKEGDEKKLNEAYEAWGEYVDSFLERLKDVGFAVGNLLGLYMNR